MSGKDSGCTSFSFSPRPDGHELGPGHGCRSLMLAGTTCAINGPMRTGPCKSLPSLALFCVLFADPASAEPRGKFVLDWVAPTGCPQQEAVQAEIIRLLGGGASAGSAAAGDDAAAGAAGAAAADAGLSVRASVGHSTQWFVSLQSRAAGVEGRRWLESTSCDGLASATALIVALMIDPVAVAAQSGQAPAPAAVAVPAPISMAKPQRTTTMLLGLVAGGTTGVLPSPDVGVGAALGLARPFWRLELRAAWGLRQAESAPLANPSGARGSFRLLAGTLAGCATFRRSVVDFGPCADVEFGAVHGEGVGAFLTTSQTTPWLGLGAGGLLVFRISRWLLVPVHADAVFPLRRLSFVVEPHTTIYRPSPIGGRLTVGLEMHF